MGDFNQLHGTIALTLPDGPLFVCRQLDGYCKGEFEDWLEATARRRPMYLLQKGKLTPMEFKLSMAAVQTSIASRALAWGGDACNASLQQSPGLIRLLHILAHTASKRDRELKHDYSIARLSRLFNDEAAQVVLHGAVKEVMDNTPNFLEPPPEEMLQDEPDEPTIQS